MGIPASQTWMTAVADQFRRQGHLWIGLSLEPPGLREAAVVTASSTHPLFSTKAITDGISDNMEPMATYERTRWKADGSQYLPSKVSAQNLAINSWADDKIVHATDTETVITFQFDKTYTIPGLLGIWDTETQSWPTVLVVEGYGLTGNAIGTYTFHNITSEKQFLACPFTNAYKVIMRIRGWSKPEWRARITESTFGTIISFEGSQLVNASTQSTVDPLSNALPQIIMSATVSNLNNEFDPLGATGYAQYLLPKQAITWQWGFEVARGVIERLPAQSVFLTDSRIPANSINATIKAGTRLDFLTLAYDKGQFTGASTTLYALAEGALNKMKLLPAYDGEHPWELDEGLKSFSTIAPIPVVAENVVLQLIANAAGMVLSINPVTGYIKIGPQVPATRELARIIDESSTLGKPEIASQERLLSIRIGVNQYTKATSRSNVYTSTLRLSEQTPLTVNFNENKLAAEVAVGALVNCTIVSSTFFSRRAELVVKPTDVNADVQITLTGIVYEENVTFFETYRDTSIDKGLEVTIENPFITNTNFLTPLTNAALNVYQRRHIISAPYQGFPELTGSDVVGVDSEYGRTLGYLLNNSVDYNGGWSGAITARVSGVPDDI